ncbi:hypothetical protein D3C81_1975460 [compost metagenome]
MNSKVPVTNTEFRELARLALIILDKKVSIQEKRIARAQYRAIIAAAKNRTR